MFALLRRYGKLLPLAMTWDRALAAMQGGDDRAALTHLRAYISGLDDLRINPQSRQRIHAYLLESSLSLRLGLTSRAFDALIDACDLMALDILLDDEAGYLARYAAGLAQRLDRLADLDARNAVNPLVTRFAAFDPQQVPGSLRRIFPLEAAGGIAGAMGAAMGAQQSVHAPLQPDQLWQPSQSIEDQALD